MTQFLTVRYVPKGVMPQPSLAFVVVEEQEVRRVVRVVRVSSVKTRDRDAVDSDTRENVMCCSQPP